MAEVGMQWKITKNRVGSLLMLYIYFCSDRPRNRKWWYFWNRFGGKHLRSGIKLLPILQIFVT